MYFRFLCSQGLNAERESSHLFRKMTPLKFAKSLKSLVHFGRKESKEMNHAGLKLKKMLEGVLMRFIDIELCKLFCYKHYIKR